MIKDALLKAAEDVGNEFADAEEKEIKIREGLVTYFKKMAREYPELFMPALMRVMPLQVNMRDNDTITVTTKVVYKTVEQMQRAAVERGIPLSIANRMVEVVETKEHERTS